MQLTCKISGQQFQISEQEQQLRKKLQAPLPDKLPRYTYQELAAFWQHFALHKRTCDATGQEIISPFGPDCPYPVWEKNHWVAQADPPSADFDFHAGFFEQLWKLFQKCPIPHNIGSDNQNCDYTDDWWHSKNCYLCHSGANCEDCSYSYRILGLKDCMFCVFSFDSELCTDLIYSLGCYNVNYALYSRNCRDSAFLFDCQNCSDCLYSWNLRNKQYCIANQQYTKEKYEEEKKKLNLASRKQYELAKAKFQDLIQTKAWWKAQYIEQCENVSGDYLEQGRDLVNCFLIQKAQDCVNTMRGYDMKDCVDSVCVYIAQLSYNSSLVQDNCYGTRNCYNLMNCKFMQYCAHCLNSENCFACCGLVGKKYCILNKQYSKEEYEKTVAQIKEKLRADKTADLFFPGYFAANPYEESLAGFWWQLSKEKQVQRGFRTKETHERKNEHYLSSSEVPDVSVGVSEDISGKIFWDEASERPFQITKRDLQFCQARNIPLPNSHYLKRIKENFAWVFFNGELRETTCALSGQKILTSIPPLLDGRIVSEEAYLKEVY